MLGKIRTDFSKFSGMRAFRSHFILGQNTKIPAHTRRDGTYVDLNAHSRMQVKDRFNKEGVRENYVHVILVPQRQMVRTHSKYPPQTYGEVAMALLKKTGVLPGKRAIELAGAVIEGAKKKPEVPAPKKPDLRQWFPGVRPLPLKVAA
jgi:hypothetical protein